MFYRMSGVMVQMLLFDAEQQNFILNADVHQMDNYKALESLKDFENISDMNTSNFLNPAKKNMLPALGNALKSQIQQKMQQNTASEELVKENAKLNRCI